MPIAVTCSASTCRAPKRSARGSTRRSPRPRPPRQGARRPDQVVARHWRCARATSCACVTWRGSPGGPRTSSATTSGAARRRDGPLAPRGQGRLLRAHRHGPNARRCAPRNHRGDGMSARGRAADRRTVDANRAGSGRLAGASGCAWRAGARLSWASSPTWPSKAASRSPPAWSPVDRARRVRHRLGDRGVRQPRDRLALHRQPTALRERRTARPAPRGDAVLHARPLHRPRSDPRPRRRRARRRELGRGRPGGQLDRADARARDRQAAHRPAHGSVATQGEGAQNLLCAYMAGALLVGLAGNAVLGLWWLDPAAALAIAALAVREGTEAWRGESCCIPSAGGDECCTTQPPPIRDEPPPDPRKPRPATRPGMPA